MGIVKDDELEIVFPAEYLGKASEGLDALRSARTIGYPLPIFGYQMDVFPSLLKTYPDLKETLNKMR